jgi:ATP-dependent DNA ligase
MNNDPADFRHPMTEEVMAQAVWLKPEQPAEIEFVERTPHGRLRHASFRRLLQDRVRNKSSFAEN